MPTKIQTQFHTNTCTRTCNDKTVKLCTETYSNTSTRIITKNTLDKCGKIPKCTECFHKKCKCFKCPTKILKKIPKCKKTCAILDYDLITKNSQFYISIEVSAKQLEEKLPKFYEKCKKYEQDCKLVIELAYCNNELKVSVYKCHKILTLKQEERMKKFIKRLNKTCCRVLFSSYYSCISF